MDDGEAEEEWDELEEDEYEDEEDELDEETAGAEVCSESGVGLGAAGCGAGAGAGAQAAASSASVSASSKGRVRLIGCMIFSSEEQVVENGSGYLPAFRKAAMAARSWSVSAPGA